jgi:hypothetical protein
MKPRLCLLLCENFMPEAEAIIKDERFKDVEVLPFKTSCEHPYSSWSSIIDPASINKEDPAQIHLLGGGCIAGLANLPGQPDRCHLHCMDQCVRFLAGAATMDRYCSQGAFILTPGWLKNWEERLKAWGFAEKTAREFFQEFAHTLVLMDTGLDPQSPERLRKFAQVAGLPYAIEPVGLDFFRLFLLEIVMAWRLGIKESQAQTATPADSRLADYAMVFELIGRLAALDVEEKAIERIVEIFSMFCAPSRVFYLPIYNDAAGNLISLPPGEGDAAAVKTRLLEFQGQNELTEDRRGFRLRINAGSAVLGIVEISEVALPEFINHYLNLGIAIAGACALAINNSRIYDRLQKTLKDLKSAHAEVNTLRGIIPICSSCKKIRDDEGFWQQVEVYIKNHSEADFSHGICPDCLVKLYPDIGRTLLNRKKI